MSKKIIAAILSLTCAVSMLAACNGGDSSSTTTSSNASSASQSDSSAVLQNVQVETSLVIDGKEIDTKDLEMLNINGVTVDFDMFRYYWLGYKSTFESANMEYTIDELKEIVIHEIKMAYTLTAMGEENGIEYDEKAQTEFMDSYNGILMNFTAEEDYAKWLSQMYLTDSAVQEYTRNNVYADLVYEKLFGENGKNYVKEEDFLKLTKSDEYARVIHILIPYSYCAPLSDEDKEGWDELEKSKQFEKLEAAYKKLTDEEKEKVKAESKKFAEEILEKAKNGENFYQLVADYNSDPGMQLADKEDITSLVGYYFTKDWNFVQEFLDGSFALEVDGISDIVESKSYGYHIIKRLPVDEEYVEKNKATLLKEYNDIVFNKICDDYFANSLKIEYSEYYDKLTLDSIK